ncbi:DUF1830 domain-containing protein [Laspinema sp. D1]|nr:DUF1830 domain-containing protein [Laspinema sp. D2b]
MPLDRGQPRLSYEKKIQENSETNEMAMPKSTNSLSFPSSDELLCYYLNSTSEIQVIKSECREKWDFERVVFPGQRLFFEAFSTAHLEIYKAKNSGLELAARVKCDRLQVMQERSSSFTTVSQFLGQQLAAC